MKGSFVSQKEKMLKALKSGAVSLKVAVNRLKMAEGSVGRVVHELRADGINIITGVNTVGVRTYRLAPRKR